MTLFLRYERLQLRAETMALVKWTAEEIAELDAWLLVEVKVGAPFDARVEETGGAPDMNRLRLDAFPELCPSYFRPGERGEWMAVAGDDEVALKLAQQRLDDELDDAKLFRPGYRVRSVRTVSDKAEIVKTLMSQGYFPKPDFDQLDALIKKADPDGENVQPRSRPYDEARVLASRRAITELKLLDRIHKPNAAELIAKPDYVKPKEKEPDAAVAAYPPHQFSPPQPRNFSPPQRNTSPQPRSAPSQR